MVVEVFLIYRENYEMNEKGRGCAIGFF